MCGMILWFIYFKDFSSGKTIISAIYLHMQIFHLLKTRLVCSLKTKCVLNGYLGEISNLLRFNCLALSIKICRELIVFQDTQGRSSVCLLEAMSKIEYTGFQSDHPAQEAVICSLTHPHPRLMPAPFCSWNPLIVSTVFFILIEDVYCENARFHLSETLFLSHLSGCSIARRSALSIKCLFLLQVLAHCSRKAEKQ